MIQRILKSFFSAQAGLIVLIALDMNIAKACTITASVEPSRAVVLAGEPVELLVTLRNSGPDEVRVPIAYPWLGARGYPGLSLRYAAEGEALSKAVPPEHSGIESVISIPANSSWSTKVYLQRFASNPSLGFHKVSWSLRTPCVGANGSEAGVVDQRGTFAFDTKRGTSASLANIAQIYSAALESTVIADRQVAVEALVVFPDPAVIPELKQMINAGYAGQALDALTKFQGNEAAREVVMGALRSNDRSQVRAALRTVSQWKTQLLPKDIEALVVAAPSGLQIDFLAYIQASHNRDYLPIVERLAASSDEAVSRAAKEAEILLKKGAPEER